jgi:hypothetical protein
MNLSEHEKKEWVAKNQFLQESYKDYCWASDQKQKDSALKRIQMILEQNPFLTYCADNGANLSGMTRYGMDYLTEKCISDIDRISKEL